MSTTVDQRVVEMRFDNSHFEKNVQTTLSTLDKLKQKLNFSGASKSLEEISTSAKKVDMGGLGRGVEAVTAKFSAMQIVGITALSNITNSALNAGKRIVKSLTIDPVTTGFSEYELKMNSIQTIMASTGESLETVNKYLNELNTYSDQTIYSFSDMTQNIGKFTNAGVKLEDAVAAIKGISNEAALSGANANEASRAMYNFAQALSAGYVKLIDWKSIENANMATVEFKDQLIQTALEIGTVKKAADGYYQVLTKNNNGSTMEGTINATKNFNDSLAYQWMTTDVLTKTLAKYADETTEIGKKATQAATEIKTFTMLMDTLKESAQSGWATTWELIFGDFLQGKSFWTYLGNTFGDIIQKSSDARNALVSDVMGSKWSKFTSIITEAGGSTEEFQKSLDKLYSTDGRSLDRLIKAHGSLSEVIEKGLIPVKYLKDALKDISGSEEKATKSTKKVTESLEDLQKITNKVIRGDFGDGEKRFKALTEAGYNHVVIQKLVNKVWEKNGKTWKDTTITSKDLAEAIEGLSKEEKESLGITEEHSKALKKLADEAGDAESDISKLMAELERPSGRQLLIDSLKNSLEAISTILGSVKDAWNGVFGDISWSDRIYDGLVTFNKFTETLVANEDVTSKLQSTLEGFFTILKGVGSVSLGAFNELLKIGWELFKTLGTVVLTITADMGKAVTKFGDTFSDKFKPVIELVKSFVDFIINLAKSVRESFGEIYENVKTHLANWSEKFKDTEAFEKISGSFETGAERIKGALEDLSKYLNEFQFTTIIDKIDKFFSWFEGTAGTIGNNGVVNGFIDSIGFVGGALATAFTNLVGFFKNFKLPEISWDKITSWFSKFGNFLDTNKVENEFSLTSVVDFLKDQFNYNIITKFKNNSFTALSNFFGDIYTNIEPIFSTIGKIFEAIKNFVKTICSPEFLFGTDKVDLPTIIDSIMNVVKLLIALQALKVLNTLAAPLDNITGAIENLTGTIKSTMKFRAMADAFKALAIALGVFTICLIIIASMDSKDALRSAGILLGVITALGLVVGGLMLLSNKIGKVDMASVVASILGVAISVALIVWSLKELDSFDFQHLGQSFGILVGVMVIMAASIGIVGKLCGGATIKSIAAIATLLIAMKTVLGLLEDYQNFDWEKNLGAIPKLAAVMLGLALVFRIMTSGIREGASAQGTALLLLAMMLSLKLVLHVIESFGKMDTKVMIKGMVATALVLRALTQVFVIMNQPGFRVILEKGQKMAGAFQGLAVALLATVAAIYLLGKMDVGTLLRGGAAVVAIFSVFSLLMFSMKGLESVKTGVILTILIGMGLILLELTLIIDHMVNIGWDKALGASASMALLLASMAGVIVVLSKQKDVSITNIAKWVIALSAISAIVYVIGNLFKEMNDVDSKNAIGNATALSEIMIVMGGLLAVLGKIKMDYRNMGRGIIGLTAMLIPLSGFALALNYLPTDNISGKKEALLVLSSVMGAMTVLLVALAGIGALIKLMGNGYTAINGIIGLTAMLVPLGAFALALNYLPMDNIAGKKEAILIVAQVMTAMTILLVATSLVGVLWAATGFLAATGLIGLVGLMTSFALFAWALNSIPMDNIKKNKPTITMLTDIMVLFKDLLVELSKIGPKVLISEIALAGMTGILTSLGIFASALGAVFSQDVIPVEKWLKKGLEILELIGSGLGRVLGGFVDGFMTTSTQNLPQIATNISGFMIQLQPFLTGLKTVENSMVDKAGMILKMIVALELGSLIRLMPGDIAKLGTKLSEFMFNALPFFMTLRMIDEKTLSSAKLMAEVVLAITKASFMQAVTDMFTLFSNPVKDLFKNLIEFAEAIVEFSDTLNSASNLNINGIKAAAEAGTLLVNMYKALDEKGGLVGSIMGEKDFADFSAGIVAFGKAIVGFSDAVSKSPINIEGIKLAATAGTEIAKLYDVIPKTGGAWQTWAGVEDLQTFGNQIVAYIDSIIGVSKKLSEKGNSVNSEQINAAATAGNSIAGLYDKVPKTDGVWQEFAGVENIQTFGRQIVAYIQSIIDVSNALNQNGEINSEGITAAKKAGEAMVELANSLPSQDSGILEKIGNFVFGGAKTTLSQFAEHLAAFGNALNTGFGTIAPDVLTANVGTAKNLINYMKQINGNLGTEDTTWTNIKQFVAGGANLTLTDFAAQLGAFGEAMNAAFGTLDPEALNMNFQTMTNIITWMKNISGTLGEEEGLLEKIGNFFGGGETTLVDVGDEIAAFAESINGAFVDINAESFASITSTIKKLVSMVKGMVDLDISGAQSFKDAIGKFKSAKITEMVTDYTTEGIGTAISNAKKILTFIKSLSGVDSNVSKNFKTAINSLAKSNVDGFVSAFKSSAEKLTSIGKTMADNIKKGLNSKKNESTKAIKDLVNAMVKVAKDKKSDFKDAGEALIGKFIKAIEDDKDKPKKKFKSAVSDALDAIDGYYDDFYGIGEDMVDGFADGINDRKWKAKAKAKAMAQAALNAAKEVLDINSPSKVFRAVGYSVPEGFAMGIDKLIGMVSNSAEGMANTAISGVKKSLAYLGNVVSGDTNTNPTIRPVLDLSDVRYGAGEISKILGNTSRLGVTANLRAINASMNAKNQNGANDDVVSAIDKLGRLLGKTNGDTYNINGITYDDGSNIRDAIETIVRFANIERRV